MKNINLSDSISDKMEKNNLDKKFRGQSDRGQTIYPERIPWFYLLKQKIDPLTFFDIIFIVVMILVFYFLIRLSY